MATINTDVYDAFIAVGAPEDKARAAAEAIPEQTGLATKADIADLKTEMANLRADIYRAIWLQGAAIIGIMTALMTAFKIFG